jgi:transposase-like protein
MKKATTRANIQRTLARSDMRELEDFQKAVKLCVEHKFPVGEVSAVLNIPSSTLYTHVKAAKEGKNIGGKGRKKTLSDEQEEVVIKWLDDEIAKGTPANFLHFKAKV